LRVQALVALELAAEAALVAGLDLSEVDLAPAEVQFRGLALPILDDDGRDNAAEDDSERNDLLHKQEVILVVGVGSVEGEKVDRADDRDLQSEPRHSEEDQRAGQIALPGEEEGDLLAEVLPHGIELAVGAALLLDNVVFELVQGSGPVPVVFLEPEVLHEVGAPRGVHAVVLLDELALLKHLEVQYMLECEVDDLAALARAEGLEGLGAP